MPDTPRLTRRLTLEALSHTPDGGGGLHSAWVPLGTLWADVRASNAREVRAAGRTGSRVTHVVMVRNAPDASPRRPEPEQRFRLGPRVFDIRGVAEAHGHDGFLTCWCEEGPST